MQALELASLPEELLATTLSFAGPAIGRASAAASSLARAASLGGGRAFAPMAHVTASPSPGPAGDCAVTNLHDVAIPAKFEVDRPRWLPRRWAIARASPASRASAG